MACLTNKTTLRVNESFAKKLSHYNIIFLSYLNLSSKNFFYILELKKSFMIRQGRRSS